MSDNDCIFCKIINKELDANIVFENEHCMVFEDINPKAEYHLLLVPKQHITNLNDVQHSQHKLITNLLLLIPELSEDLGLDGYRVITNVGKSAGQEVFHLHFHILSGENLPGF